MRLSKHIHWIVFSIVLAALFFAPAQSHPAATSSYIFEAALPTFDKLSFLSSASAKPTLRCWEVCTERVPPGCRRVGHTWDECACVKHETVCDTPPDPTISGTLNCSVWGNGDWCIGNQTLALTATEPDGENVLISGDLNGETFACGPGAGSTSCSIPLPEGTGTANYLATSAQGTTASGAKSWQRDATPPVIEGGMSGAAGENGWFTSSVQFSASVTEAGSGLGAFEYSLDGANWTAQASPFNLTLNDGNHTIQVRASDLAGNLQSISQPVKIDSVQPTLDRAITGTAGANGWYTSATLVEASASDPAPSSGFTVEITTDGANWTPYTAPLTLNDGAYDVQIRVKDTAGNQVASADFVNVDTISPTVDGTLAGTLGTANWYISPVQASAATADATSGVASTEYSLDGGASWLPYTAPVNFGDGQHSLQFQTTDMAGWSATSPVYTFKVDASAPQISLPSRWYIWESITFELEEEISGFTDIELQIMDSQSRWKKVEKHWESDQASFAYTLLWDRQFADGILAPIGNYPVVVRAWDEAGNMREKRGQIVIPQPGAAPLPTLTNTPTPTPEAVETEPPATEEALLPLIPVTTATPLPQAAPTQAEQEEKPESVFSFSSPANNSGSSSSTASDNILWGATATAAIGAFAAQIAERKRREREEEAKRLAALRAKEAPRSDYLRKRGAEKAAIAEWREKQKKLQALKEKRLAMQEKILGIKEKILDPKIPPPPAFPTMSERSFEERMMEEAEADQRADVKAEVEKIRSSGYVPPDMSWKRDDMRAAETAAAAKKAAETKKKEEKKSWWEKTVDWVDNHQAEVSLGIGITAGIAAIALSGGAATPLVAAAWMAGSAAVAGGAVAAGTVALNTHYGRATGHSIWRNIGLAAGGAVVTSGLGFLLAGGGVQAGVYKVGNSITGACVQHPTACARASSAFSLWDTVETVALRAKFAIQTAQGDPRAADTLLEIQLEQADGGMPGNTTAREVGDGLSDLTDDSATLTHFVDALTDDSKRIWRSTKNNKIYVSKSSGEAFELAEEWVEIGGTDGKYSDDIAKQIAELSTQGSGDRVVLGAWGNDGEYIQAAVDEGGIFLDVGPEVGQYIQKGDIEFWPINEHFLQSQLESGVRRIDFVSDDIAGLLDKYQGVPDEAVPYRVREIRWLEANAENYIRIENAWVLDKP